MDDVIELQIRLTYLEQSVDELNAVVTRQSQELSDLQATLRLLYQALDNKQAISAFDVLKDKPPHY